MSTKSINILGILALGLIFWMNLGSLEYLSPNKPQNIDVKALLSEIFETRFFHMTRRMTQLTLYKTGIKSQVLIIWSLSVSAHKQRTDNQGL